MHRGRQTERDRTERRESSRDSKGKTEAGCPEWGSYSKQGGLGFQSCGRGRRTPTEAAASSLTGQDPTWLLSLSPRPPPPPSPDSQEPCSQHGRESLRAYSVPSPSVCSVPPAVPLLGRAAADLLPVLRVGRGTQPGLLPG